MLKQNQIKRTLSQPDAIADISQQLKDLGDLKLSHFADNLCQQYNFIDPQGNYQQAGCIKALRALEQAKKIVLPEMVRRTKKRSPRRLDQALPKLTSVPNEVDQLLNLILVLVETEDQIRLWNEMMENDHPRGAGLLVGRQIRYLVQSDHGVLGGFAFSAAALHLRDRDRWIGWTLESRRDNLHWVVNMNRFLIRPDVHCKNLASHLMGKVVRQLPKDFEVRYGYRPLLLESFVDTQHYTGTCYQASNWLMIGKTQGRGRQDQLMVSPETIKDIYVYPLEKDFRKMLGLSAQSGLGPINVTHIYDGRDWAEQEFGGAELGDARLNKRLIDIAANKAEKPGVAYASVVDGNWAKTKGYYRMIDAPDESAITLDNILKPHREQTLRRMQGEKVVLCLQDGCDLNYNNLSQCDGLGPIGSNQTGSSSLGLHMHSTFAINTQGLPLGVLHADILAPEARNKDDERSAKDIPIEEKKTFCWIEGLRDCQDIKAQLPQTKIISVMDREADFFELLDEQRTHCSKIDVIIRAKHNRNTTGKLKLFNTVKESPVKTEVLIKVARKSARSKKSKQKAAAKRAARTAQVSIRYVQVSFNPASHLKDKEPMTVWAIHVCENNPPADEKPIEWFLLTTIDITSVDDAINCINWYCLRWRIEDWHRVLKSGCGIEKIAHKTATRLKRAIAINLVIAWRIMLMTLLGREAPDLPPEVMFSDIEIRVLNAYAKKKTSPRLIV